MAVKHRTYEVMRLNRKAGCLGSGRWTRVCPFGLVWLQLQSTCSAISSVSDNLEEMQSHDFFKSWDRKKKWQYAMLRLCLDLRDLGVSNHRGYSPGTETLRTSSSMWAQDSRPWLSR